MVPQFDTDRVEALSMYADGYNMDGSELQRLVNNAAKMHGDQYRIHHHLSRNKTEATVMFRRDQQTLLDGNSVGIKCHRHMEIKCLRNIILDNNRTNIRYIVVLSNDVDGGEGIFEE